MKEIRHNYLLLSNLLRFYGFLVYLFGGKVDIEYHSFIQGNICSTLEYVLLPIRLLVFSSLSNYLKF